MIKLWFHETTRVFSDLLVILKERDNFNDMLEKIIKDRFGSDAQAVNIKNKILFGSIV